MKNFILIEMTKNNYLLDKINKSNPINKKKSYLSKKNKINQNDSSNQKINIFVV